MGKLHIGLGVAGLAIAALVSSTVTSHSADFYAGKRVSVIIGTAAGGGYDRYARTLARHMGEFIPGKPDLIPKNMPGAGSLKAARYLYVAAPKDGTEFGIVHRDIVILPLMGEVKDIDPSKFGWIGNIDAGASVCFSWHTTPIKTFEDTYKHQFVVATTGKGSSLDSFERPLINIFHINLKAIVGYKGAHDMDLAVERGEVMGRCGVSWSSVWARHQSWLKGKKIHVLVKWGPGDSAALKNVPSLLDLAKTEEDRKVLDLLTSPSLFGRPFFTPPGVPADRIAILRTAFNKTMKDKAFREEAKKLRLELAPVPGTELEAELAKLYAFPKSILARAREAAK